MIQIRTFDQSTTPKTLWVVWVGLTALPGFIPFAPLPCPIPVLIIVKSLHSSVPGARSVPRPRTARRVLRVARREFEYSLDRTKKKDM